MTDYKLHHGDMLDVMPTLAKGSVAMVFADIPYGNTQCFWDSPVCLDLMWASIDRCAKLGAVTCVMAMQPFASAVVASQKQLFRYELIYAKKKPTGFFNANERPLSGHENVLVFSRYTCNPNSRDKMLYHPQKNPGQPYTATRTVARARYTQAYDQNNTCMTNNISGLRHPGTVLTFARCTNNLHPTQKPVALLEWLIATYTNPGDTVLDPCFGSNTTGVACARLRRKYIGIEKDAEYFRIGKDRLEREVEALRTGPAQGRLAV